MNKLQNKVFFTIFIILTMSLLSFTVVSNVHQYNEERKAISNSLETVVDASDKISKKDKGSIERTWKFMDYVVYSVIIDGNGKIGEIINHSKDKVISSEIRSAAEEILSDSNSNDIYIGCLYFEDYSYAYANDTSLVILDNGNIKDELWDYLKISIIIFALGEVAIFIVSRLITRWIIKPVKESFNKQKQFIADASHELKTPLSVIIASSEALEDNPSEGKWLNNIKYEADRMNDLITDLLELSESEKENNKNYEVGNLSKVVELSSLAFEGKTFEKNLHLKMEIEDAIQMKMDEKSIKQLIEILLDNGIKHSKEKGQIEISLKQRNGEVVLEVTNEGEPIPKGEEEKIFERFYRVDKSRNRAENRYGLGLAIAKSIVENHNGKISAASEDGKTIFKIIFKKA